jgi:hypothetical protein
MQQKREKELLLLLLGYGFLIRSAVVYFSKLPTLKLEVCGVAARTGCQDRLMNLLEELKSNHYKKKKYILVHTTCNY